MRHPTPNGAAAPREHAPPVDPFEYDRGIQRTYKEMRLRGAFGPNDFAPLEHNYPPHHHAEMPRYRVARERVRASVYAAGGWLWGDVAAFPYFTEGETEWSVCERGVLRRVGDADAELITWDDPRIRLTHWGAAV